MVVGMDIDQEALQFAKTRCPLSRVHFLTGDAMALPLLDNSMDVVVCNHIYEHVPEASQMMAEIHRVLRKEGFCYFSAGNKYVFLEGHYRLPMLSWLPRPIAHLYLRLTGKGSYYYERHLSLRGLRRLVRKFQVHDYTISIIKNPERYHATDLFDRKGFSHRWVRWLAPYLYPWIPTYIWVLRKR
jgi:ubiquinone/menaquinone biosynthesis C-methylase UbiE